MANVTDIDTKAAVTKFLQSQTVIDKEDKTANSADEIQTVLESVALSFLLYPQAALSFALRAKNVLQQVVTADVQILDYLLKAIADIQNPDNQVTDTSDLVDAQSALVEVDRLGRVSSDVTAYTRYVQSINSFLDTKLAKSLKRRRRNEFERTGSEAAQDLFKVLGIFGPTHGVMAARITALLNSIADFQSVALTKIVSATTLTRVRASLDKVIQGIATNQLSNTATAIELLSGAAALSSISNSRNINDPSVDTGTYPANRIISVRSNVDSANAEGVGSTVDLSLLSTPWTFSGIVDPRITGGTAFSITLPVTGGSGRSYVKAATGQATFDITAPNSTLYVEFDGIAPPANEPVMVRAVVLPTTPAGAVPLSAVLAALNNGITGLIDGTAIELAPGTGRIAIYGSSSVTRIVVRSEFHGDFDIFGNYVPAPGSVHLVLGFSDNQTSGDPNKFSPTEFVDLIDSWLPGAVASVVNGVTQITSNSTDLRSSLSFSGEIAAAFGFSIINTYLVEPSYLELIENGLPIDPTTLGIFIGSIVTAPDQLAAGRNSLFGPIDSIDGTHLLFAPGTPLPRCLAGTLVRVVSPLVFAVQTLLTNLAIFDGVFAKDPRDLQRVLSPLLSKPTLAQINDAVKVIQAIQVKVNDLLTRLTNTVVRPDRSEFETVATQITASLVERGLDRSLELLQSCQFSSFFSITNEEASKGTRFLKASEQVGRNELAQTTAEQDIPDVDPKGTTPDQNLLPGEELLENEEQQ